MGGKSKRERERAREREHNYTVDKLREKKTAKRQNNIKYV